MAVRLRETLRPVLLALAGDPPRPVRLMRGIGLDKSLASRLVRALRAETDSQFLHLLPSPTGLRILTQRGRDATPVPEGLDALDAAIDSFAAWLVDLPGGRLALDARLGQAQSQIRERREHMARQASFKAVSFLFGHYCDTLVTSIFLFPSAQAGQVDAIEVHRRIGLRRITPGTPLPLLSLHTPDGGIARVQPADGSGPGDGSPRDARRYFVDAGCSLPLPDLEVEREGSNSTFLLGPGSPEPLPARLTTALRLQAVEELQPSTAWTTVRNYMLHTPCQQLAREVYLADGLWPDADPFVGFCLPGPTGSVLSMPPPGQPHYRRLNLSAPIEPLPSGPSSSPDGVDDHVKVLAEVLQRAGLAGTRWRGWRWQVTYPVPLVEMQLGFRFAGQAGA